MLADRESDLYPLFAQRPDSLELIARVAQNQQAGERRPSVRQPDASSAAPEPKQSENREAAFTRQSNPDQLKRMNACRCALRNGSTLRADPE
jgi:hypothetical protein